jgi:hypothetical protein
MAIQYTWTISALDVKLSEDGLEKIVTNVHWRLLGTEDSHSADVYGSVSLDPPVTTSFIEFDALTKEDIVSWIEDKLDVDQLKTSLETQINSLKNPVTASLPPPWQ